MWSASELAQRDTALSKRVGQDHSARETLADYGNPSGAHRFRFIHRDADGVPEIHDDVIDVVLVRSGAGAVLVGGEMLNRTGSRGTGIAGGTRYPVGAGDILHIPAKTPHGYLVPEGGTSPTCLFESLPLEMRPVEPLWIRLEPPCPDRLAKHQEVGMRVWSATRGFIVVFGLFSLAAVGCAPAADPVEEAAPMVAEYTPPAFTPESRDLTLADFERMMDELSNWGRWGPTDQLGAANLITPAKRLEAIGLVTEGITVSLAHPLLMEVAEDVPSPFQRELTRVPDYSGEPPSWVRLVTGTRSAITATRTVTSTRCATFITKDRCTTASVRRR